MDALFFHPKIIHLPMALAILMPLIAGGIALAWWRDWLPARTWILVVALQAVLVASGVVALQTGETEEERVEQIVTEQFVEAHEHAAEAFVQASGAALGLMMLALAMARHKIGLHLALTATLGTLVVLGFGYRTGQTGGALVYEHGAAAAYVGDTPTPTLDQIQSDDDHSDHDDD